VATSDGDTLALSLFRQWTAATREYDRPTAGEKDLDDNPAEDLLTEIEDRILEISGGAVSLALKTYFNVRQDQGAWTGGRALLRIREAFAMTPIGMPKLPWPCCGTPLPWSRRSLSWPRLCCTKMRH
jgi:hypothetical protein